MLMVPIASPIRSSPPTFPRCLSSYVNQNRIRSFVPRKKVHCTSVQFDLFPYIIRFDDVEMCAAFSLRFSALSALNGFLMRIIRKIRSFVPFVLIFNPVHLAPFLLSAMLEYTHHEPCHRSNKPKESFVSLVYFVSPGLNQVSDHEPHPPGVPHENPLPRRRPNCHWLPTPA